MKFCEMYSEKLPTSTLLKLDSDAFKLDISSPSSLSIPLKNLDVCNLIERQVRNLVSINSHSRLVSFCRLSILILDSAILNRFLQTLAKSLRHSMALSVLLAAELQ